MGERAVRSQRKPQRNEPLPNWKWLDGASMCRKVGVGSEPSVVFEDSPQLPGRSFARVLEEVARPLAAGPSWLPFTHETAAEDDLSPALLLESRRGHDRNVGHVRTDPV